jgi:hypothetical protein
MISLQKSQRKGNSKNGREPTPGVDAPPSVDALHAVEVQPSVDTLPDVDAPPSVDTLHAVEAQPSVDTLSVPNNAIEWQMGFNSAFKG